MPKVTYVVDSKYFIDSVEWNKQTVYELKLPNNVGSWAARVNISNGGLNFYSEYAEKSNDPNATNGQIYKKKEQRYTHRLLIPLKALEFFFPQNGLTT